MFFNSVEFLIFLPLVFLTYWFVVDKNLRLQNGFVLVASYVFYGWWDYRFLGLIVLSTLVDYLVGVRLSKEDKQTKRNILLWISLLVNLGMLGFFKYFNFFIGSFVDAFTFFGAHLEPSRLSIILPVGISFYTFQTLSYTIDVYKRKMEPTNDPIAFAAYVSFFPQLVAGPIERASNLLPQFLRFRKFDYEKATDGLRHILWGLFKKVVVADSCAPVVNMIFENHEMYNGSTLLLGAVLFAFQIYCDFSGYSDIAIGTARLFGFGLMRNFAFPYFSRDIAEFWRRWHISLSTWFRDYVYFPLGGSRGGLKMRIRNVFIIFMVSGFWHGANWTFLIWGTLHALYYLPVMLANSNRNNLGIVAANSFFPSLKELFQILVTFLLATLAWVFFRAESVTQAFSILGEILSPSLFEGVQVERSSSLSYGLLGIAFLLVLEWFSRKKQHGLEIHELKIPVVLRWGFYLALCVFIMYIFGGSEQQEFIYFQF